MDHQLVLASCSGNGGPSIAPLIILDDIGIQRRLGNRQLSSLFKIQQGHFVGEDMLDKISGSLRIGRVFEHNQNMAPHGRGGRIPFINHGTQHRGNHIVNPVFRHTIGNCSASATHYIIIKGNFPLSKKLPGIKAAHIGLNIARFSHFLVPSQGFNSFIRIDNERVVVKNAAAMGP